MSAGKLIREAAQENGLPERRLRSERIGLRGYRFSVSWPRAFPEEGKHSERGLDFCGRLVEEHLSAAITPRRPPYPWDLPLWAYEKGGWPSDGVILVSHKTL